MLLPSNLRTKNPFSPGNVESFLSLVAADWARGSQGYLRVYSINGFDKYGFDSLTHLEAMKKTASQLVYTTQYPTLEKSIVFPDEVIFITSRLESNVSNSFAKNLFSLFSSYFNHFSSSELFVPWDYFAFSTDHAEEFVDFRKRQWLRRWGQLNLTLPAQSVFLIEETKSNPITFFGDTHV